MQDKDKQRLKRQLEQLAEGMAAQDDVEILLFVLSSCSALLRFAEGAMSYEFPESVQKEINAGYLSLSKRIEHFYEEHLIEEEAAGKKLKNMLDSVLAKQEEANEALQKYEEAKAESAELQKQIESYKKELELVKAGGDNLREQLDEYSPEKLQEKKKENDELRDLVDERRGKLEELQKQLEELTKDRDDKNRKINDLKNQIQALPTQNRQLYKNLKGLEFQLNDLKKMETECCEERQEELRKQIKALQHIVLRLKEDTDALSNRLEDLKRQKSMYENELHVLSTEVIQILNASTGDLKRILAGHEKRLKETEETAEKLAKNLDICLQKRDEYKNWFDADQSPLEAMIAGIKEPENEILRKTFDVGQMPSVKEKMKQTRQNLEYLDQLLTMCAAAAQEDLQRIRGSEHSS